MQQKKTSSGARSKTKETKPEAKKSTAKKAATPKKAPASKQSKAAAPAAENKGTPILGFCITAFIALMLLFLLIFDDMAFFGSIMRPFLCGLVGEWGLLFMPAYLIAILVTWFKDRKNDKVAMKWVFASISYLTLIMSIHYFATDDAAQSLGANMWKLGKAGVGTGLIGGNAYAALHDFIGEAATITLLIIVFIVTLPLLFNSTPLRAARAFIRNLRTLTVQVADTTDDEEEEITAYVPEESDRKGRAGVELRDPKKYKKASEKTQSKKRALPILEDEDEGNTAGEPVSIPRQIEINRTRTQPESEPAEDYKEIFADDGKRMPEAALEEEAPQPPFDFKSSALFESNAPDTEDKPTEAEEIKAEEEPIEEPKEEPIEEVTLEVESTPVVSEEAVYVFPPISLLTAKSVDKEGFSPEEVQRTSDMLVETLANFGVRAKIINTSCGPTVTRYELQPDAGVRVRQIANLSDDIALHLAATSIRMECPIPGKSAVGIEIPNKNKNVVRLRELIEDTAFKSSKSNLLCCLGMDVVGNPVFLDIAKMPHLLIAGATGMGKSVCINSLIVSLLYRAKPDEVKLILIDPKKVEFADYNGIPHLLVPVVTEPKKAAGSLSWAVMEMERRFSEIQEVGARNLEEYNEITADNPEKEYIPQVVIVIDELADLMMTAPGEVESSICRLAQKARAAGMYLIIGTQRPSVDVITGLIKANVPSRIACKVASQVDSRTILDIAGAEKLMGRGDMLYNPVGVLKPIRVQGAFVEGREVISVCTYLKQAAEAKYSEDVMAIIEKEAQLCGEKPSKRQGGEAEGDDGSIDPLEMDAIELALECDTISTSLIQRRLSVGYGRAARIIDKLEQKGIVGQFDASAKKRKVLITKEAFMQMKMNNADAANAKESTEVAQ